LEKLQKVALQEEKLKSKQYHAAAGPAALQTQARFENKDIQQNHSFSFALEEQNKQTPKRLGDKRSPLLLLTSKKRSFLHSPGAKSIQKRIVTTKNHFCTARISFFVVANPKKLLQLYSKNKNWTQR
jgi:hypothetical protein